LLIVSVVLVHEAQVSSPIGPLTVSVELPILLGAPTIVPDVHSSSTVPSVVEILLAFVREALMTGPPSLVHSDVVDSEQRTVADAEPTPMNAINIVTAVAAKIA
jgi:hypothetical protein